MTSKRLKLFLFRFHSKDEETAFQKIHHNPDEARKIIIFGLIVYALYLFQDLFLFPEYFRIIFFIRIGISLLVSIILFFSTYSRYYQQFSTAIFIGLAFSTASGIILIEYFVSSSPYAGLYFYGIAQVLMVFYGTGKVRLIPSIFCGLFIIIPAILVDTIYVESDIYRIVTKSLFMSTMMGLGIIVSTIIQHTARERFLSHQKLEQMSMTDALTGLNNRLFYQNIIINEISNYTKIHTSSRYGCAERLSDKTDNSIYAFILLDIDYFKQVNDSYGHEAGDHVLKELSKRILKIVRTDDSLIRWGGEEFLLLMRNTQLEYIEILVERIINEVSEKPYKIGNLWKRITVSGGISVVSRNSDNSYNDSESLFELADKALYFSKENGRNRFTLGIAGETNTGKAEYFKNISCPVPHITAKLHP